MIRKVMLPVVAGGMLMFAVAHAVLIQREEPETPPPMPPPTTPFGNTVAGAGMIEPSTEASGTGMVAVGSQLAGVVTRVAVRIGQPVKAGELLFELDNRQTEAELRVRQRALAIAEEQLRKLKAQPRPEEVPVTRAQVDVAEANLKLMQDQYERARRLIDRGGIAQEELVTREQAYQLARAQLAQARASLALVEAGAWQLDMAIAAANVEQARAQVDQVKTTLAILQVRAPADGTILQVNVRPGEYVSTMGGQSLVMMGNLSPMHVRVNVDEEDIPRLRLGAPARARIRGDAQQETIPLRYVRLEPFVVPKVSLTGINVERVDTRVVQLIYAINPDHKLVQEKKVVVGQIVDVFIDTRATNGGEYQPGKSP